MADQLWLMTHIREEEEECLCQLVTLRHSTSARLSRLDLFNSCVFLLSNLDQQVKDFSVC